MLAGGRPGDEACGGRGAASVSSSPQTERGRRGLTPRSIYGESFHSCGALCRAETEAISSFQQLRKLFTPSSRTRLTASVSRPFTGKKPPGLAAARPGGQGGGGVRLSVAARSRALWPHGGSAAAAGVGPAGVTAAGVAAVLPATGTREAPCWDLALDSCPPRPEQAPRPRSQPAGVPCIFPLRAGPVAPRVQDARGGSRKLGRRPSATPSQQGGRGSAVGLLTAARSPEGPGVRAGAGTEGGATAPFQQLSPWCPRESVCAASRAVGPMRPPP